QSPGGLIVRKTLPFVLLGWLPLACEDTSLRPTPTFVVAEFDPAAAPPRVPTPNDLARDPTTGRITVPLAANASQAEKDFAAYLATLDAYPPGSTATEPFTAALDPATVHTGPIVVLDVTTGARINDALISFDPQSFQLTVDPATAWPSGHTIAIAVLGGPNGVRGADGRAVVASPAVFFARSTRPRSNCTAPRPNCTSASPFIPLDQAIGAERLRQALAPMFAFLDAQGIPRNQVVVAWTFGISSRPFMAFNPANGRIPFPNDILRNPVTGKVNLPINPSAPAQIQKLTMELNQLTGFSTTGSATALVDLPAGDALDPTSDGVHSTMPNTTITIAGNAVALTPNLPLGESTQYFVAITTELHDTAGNPVEPPPLMVFLRGQGPLFDGMHSTVAELSDAQAAQLEPLRRALNQAIDVVGIPREALAIAWGFTT